MDRELFWNLIIYFLHFQLPIYFLYLNPDISMSVDNKEPVADLLKSFSNESLDKDVILKLSECFNKISIEEHSCYFENEDL